MSPSYFPVFFWSLLIFFSFWGYGELLRRRIDRPEFADLGWGLTCAWGMSVVLALGGVLMALRIAKAANLTLVVLAGAAVAVFYLAGKITAKPAKANKGKSKAKNPKSAAFHFPLSAFRFSDLIPYLLALFVLASSIAWPFQIDPNDDLICYLMFPEKILSTGTLIDIFSLRRALTLGGHSFLQALVLIVGDDRSGHVADLGLGKVILFGIAMGFTRGSSWQHGMARLLIALFILFFPVPRINTMSAYTGSALLLALMQSLIVIKPGTTLRGRCILFLPPTLLCAGCATLRPFFGLPAILMIAVALLLQLLRVPLKNANEWIRALGIGLMPLLFMSPWMAVLYASNGTLYLPPFSGNVNTAFLNNNVATGIPQILWSYLLRPEIYPLLLCFPLVLLAPRRLLALLFAIITLAVALAVALKMSTMPSVEMPRYLTPLLLPLAVLALLNLKLTPAPCLVCIGLFCALALCVNLNDIILETKVRILGLPKQITEYTHLHPDSPTEPGTYKAGIQSLQNAIPRGARILAVVDFPYLLDYARNDIQCIDVMGAAGPDGGIPFLQGKDALNRYLRSQGVEYVVSMDFDKALLLYNRAYWLNHPRGEWYYRTVFAPRFLDVMENLDSLRDWGQTLAHFQNMSAFKLPALPN